MGRDDRVYLENHVKIIQPTPSKVWVFSYYCDIYLLKKVHIFNGKIHTVPPTFTSQVLGN